MVKEDSINSESKRRSVNWFTRKRQSVQNYLKEKERTCCTNPGRTGCPLHLGWSSNGSRHVGSAQEMPIRCENENIFWSLEDVKALTWFTLLSGNLASPGSATLTWTSLCSRFAWCSAKPSSQRLNKEHWRTLNWSPKVKYHFGNLRLTFASSALF